MGPSTTGAVRSSSNPASPWKWVAATLVVLAVVAWVGGPLVIQEFTEGAEPGGVQDPIQHVVIVMMENHPYDNLFGTYCLQTGLDCAQTGNGIPFGTCIPFNTSQPGLGCIRPFPFNASQLVTDSPPHEWNATVRSINNGAMNGFYQAERTGDTPFGYYNGTTVPVYWDLAQQYALGDNFFSSALSYSLPNHWYLMAGQAPANTENRTVLETPSGQLGYLDQANRTQTVADLLNATPSVSWKYYDWSLESYGVATNATSGFGEGSAYNYWSPLAGKYESYTGWYRSHFVPRSTFFNDTAVGQLPSISWVIPAQPFSDHPPANLTAGESFIADIVDAVESSAVWSSTAIFVSWDDYGGFYDHVPPPSIDPLGLSFRVPLLVISPYTPAGTIVHDLGSFDSLLHFVEWRFGLGCLTPRDCTAPLPLAYFDFHSGPRAPILFPTDPAMARYPMAPVVRGVGGLGVGLPGTTGCSIYCIFPDRWEGGPPAAGLDPTALD